MAAAHAARLRVLPIDGIDIPAVLALIWKPAPSPALAELLRHCRDAFAAPQPASALR